MTIPKFRVWLKREQRMIESYDILAIDYENEEIVTQKIYSERGLAIERDIHSHDFDDVNLMQSTGLKDKNGEEIFEGDIVQDGGRDVGVVVYDKECGAYGLKYKGNLIITFDSLDRICDWYGSVVIGNIYENPEPWGIGRYYDF